MGTAHIFALTSWRVLSLGTSHHNNHISISPPPARKDGTPSCQVWLVGGQKKEGWLNLVTCIGVVSRHKLVSGDLGIRMLSVSIDGQPVPFPAPLAGSCFKLTSGKSCSSCRDISQQGPQGPPVRELVTGDPMACSITRWPCIHLLGTIACCQIWQLSPRLEHGRVESINQLAWYHAQIDTSTKWCCQFCSGETRFDRYGVHPKRLAFQVWQAKEAVEPGGVLVFSYSHRS